MVKMGQGAPVRRCTTATTGEIRLAAGRVTGQSRAASSESAEAVMCWQSVACIPGALVEGNNIGPQDVCWANADWARAYPCGLGCMQANVATSESPSSERRTLCICSQPGSLVWCQITKNPICNARAVPTEQALAEATQTASLEAGAADAGHT